MPWTWFGLHVLPIDHVEYMMGMHYSVFATEDPHQKREEWQGILFILINLHRVGEDILKHLERCEGRGLVTFATTS